MGSDAIIQQANTRKDKINYIFGVINIGSKKGLMISKQKLFAKCSFQWGTSKRVFNEYISILTDIDKIKSDEDNLYIPDDWIETKFKKDLKQKKLKECE